MVQIIKKTKEYYQCGECHMQYEEKEWAEKCETWCKEHHSCNLEIIAHAVKEEDKFEKDKPKMENTEFMTHSINSGSALSNVEGLTKLFYGLIGIVSSLLFFIVLYWSLRTNSSIASLIENTYDKPLYFWPYVILTFASIILFGVNAILFVYRWRKFGPLKFKKQGATGGGSLVAVTASACPVCGSIFLSAIGIAGGLAAFPLGGLELKALSVGLLALPIWLTIKDMKKLECGDGTCPIPQDPSYKEEKDKLWLLGVYAVIVLFVLVGWSMLKTDPALAQILLSKKAGIINLQDNNLQDANFAAANNPVFDEVVAKMLPEKGFQSKIILGNSVVELVQQGVIDKVKFENIYKSRGGFPDQLKDVLTAPSNNPILLTKNNVNFLVNLLWPIGLANHMETNKQSLINGKSLFNFASTGGWNLGKEKNGGAYFNKLNIVSLTPAQEALVTKIAKNSYRPCCDNSTFFQDCNHGSALLGLLELGVSQGLTENQLWREALAFNSFWFPQNYIYNALYFKIVKGLDWDKVDPKIVMGKDFSSSSGNYKIQTEVAKIPNLMPNQKGHGGGGGCGA